MIPACTVSPANFMNAQLKVRSIHNELRFAKQLTQEVIIAAVAFFHARKIGGLVKMDNGNDQRDQFKDLAAAIGATSEELAMAFRELQRRGLISDDGKTVSPLAMRRATTDTERHLASHLAGYMLTENSFIVRRAGSQPGLPTILNTRISVEQIASYFKEGWGVAEIERDLPILTRAEIEAAIQFYLNHRAEIERDLQHSREIYEANASKPEMITA